MDAATRKLALFVLTQPSQSDRTTAATKVAALVAAQQFGEEGEDAAVRDKTKAVLIQWLDLNADLLELIVDSVEEALADIGKSDSFDAARKAMVSHPEQSLTDGTAKKIKKLVSKGLSDALKKRLDAVLHDLTASLDTLRAGMEVKTARRSSDGPKTAAVFGAGIAGLTAAHELAERGFEVTVYEMAADERYGEPPLSGEPPVKLGGMAASHRASAPDPLPSVDEPDQNGSTSVIRPFRAAWESLPTEADYPVDLPGEHGFRFFPAYYLHIWDMLQRIPVTDKIGDSWELTHRTVFDNIQRVVTQATTTPVGRPSVVFPREAPRSVAEFLGGLGQLRELGFTPSDVSTFTGRLARYLATSPTRRAREFEDISAYEFFVGVDPVSGRAMYDYSRAFDDQLRNMPKVLAAFDGFWGDARTNLSTYLQLQLRMDRRDNKADGVLRGPTSDSWFDHWYRHLKNRLGVGFVRWKLESFQLVAGTGGAPDELTARGIALPSGSADSVTADYYVVALDAPYAEKVVETLATTSGVGGTVRGLQGWTTEKPREVPPIPESAKGSLPKSPVYDVGLPSEQRVPLADGNPGAYNMQELGVQPWDRYQTLSGLQFYFDTEFQLVHGHVYYTDTPWGLSSINQTGMWEAEHRPLIPGGKYVSVLSVDIGDWNTPSPAVEHPDPECREGRAAKDCSPDEIAAEVWRQIITSLGNDIPRAAQTFPTPMWYMLDRSFVVGDDVRNQKRILENRAPYLVPIVSDWQNRPGGDPWNPHHSSLSYRRSEARKTKDAGEHVWAAEHGGYEVHCDRLVFAGTWTRTFTRMTSMEAACESGRHAVNAILDHLIRSQTGDERGDDVGLRWMWPFGFLDQSGSGPIRQPTPVGDYCYIFDIENREPAEFRPTRRLDREFAVMGQPHPWELGGVDAFMRTAAAGGGGAMLDPAMPLDPNSAGFMNWIVGHLTSYRRFLESLDRQTAGSAYGGGSLGQMFRTGAGTGGEPADPDDGFDQDVADWDRGMGRYRVPVIVDTDQRTNPMDYWVARRGLENFAAGFDPFRR